MIQILNKESGESLGTISEEELQILVKQLEEEDSHDQDYWIDTATIDLLEAKGAPAKPPGRAPPRDRVIVKALKSFGKKLDRPSGAHVAGTTPEKRQHYVGSITGLHE